MRKRILSTIMAACMGLTVLISPISNMSSVVAKEQPAQVQQVVAQPQEVYIVFDKDLGNGVYGCYMTSIVEFNKNDILNAKPGSVVTSVCGNAYPVVSTSQVMSENAVSAKEFKTLQKQEGLLNIGIADPTIAGTDDPSCTGYYFLKEGTNGRIKAFDSIFMGPALEYGNPYGEKIYNLILAPQATVDATALTWGEKKLVVSGAEFLAIPKGIPGNYDNRSAVYKGIEIYKPAMSGGEFGACAVVLNGVIISMEINYRA